MLHETMMYDRILGVVEGECNESGKLTALTSDITTPLCCLLLSSLSE